MQVLILRIMLAFFLVGLLVLPADAEGSPAQNAPVKDSLAKGSPAQNAPRVWRVIYVEGGPYADYVQIFGSLVRGLAALRLIPSGNILSPKNPEDTRPMWDWLVENANGGRLHFLADGYYSASWTEGNRAVMKADILKRIREQNDVDMILAYGTWASVDMATDEHTVPVMSMSVTDAVQAGIVRSIGDSGRDHVHAQIEVGRFERQVAVFHDVFQFKTLGIPYEDSPDGRSAVALAALLAEAERLGVAVVHCKANYYSPDRDRSFNNLRECVKKLATSSDAIFLTTNPGMQWDRMPELLEPIIEAKIPSFSQSGPEEARLGVLMSIAQNSFDNEGMSGARAIEQVINGAKPREVSQTFEGPLGLAINLKMAQLIGWEPSFELLSTVDELHQEIGKIHR